MLIISGVAFMVAPLIIYLVTTSREPARPPIQARPDLPRDLREELNAAYERIWRQ